MSEFQVNLSIMRVQLDRLKKVTDSIQEVNKTIDLLKTIRNLNMISTEELVSLMEMLHDNSPYETD